jgi:ubiquinone/menaquinone biosynthesis C-methylase UbiE
MDRPDTPPAEVAACLADLARLNRVGAIHSILVHLGRLVAGQPGTLRVLDAGTGAGDVPLAVARWARRRRWTVRVVAFDLQPVVAAVAARTVRQAPEVAVMVADALRTPLRAGAVDVAVCSLMLHHLPEEAVVGLLRELDRVARVGFVVSDLRRSRRAWLATWLLTRAISRNRLTRHDGPLSVRRAYTRAELARLAERAGLPAMRWSHAPAFRVIGVHDHGRRHAG